MGKIFNIDGDDRMYEPLFNFTAVNMSTESNEEEVNKAASSLYKLYYAFVKAGFNDGQAMTLLLAIIASAEKMKGSADE